MSVLRILALFAATAAALPALAKPAAHGMAVENGIRWQSCLNSGFQRWFDEAPPPGLRCGYLEVPLAYATPPAHAAQAGEQTVRLALTLQPATGPKKGSVVMISGGPGLPGINPYLGNDAHVARLRKSYDIIGYDPRGVGQSTPKISCQLAEGDETPTPDDNDVAGAENQTRTLIAACIKQTGADVLQHIGTDEAVNDLNAIRHALGEPGLTAVAYSYGTKVAALYAERFPKKTRALVLDGVVDLAEDDFTQRMNQERGFQQSFLRFAAYCGKTDSCQLGGGANQALQRYHTLLRKLHDQPFVTAAGYEISADDVLTVTRSLLLWPERWHELATVLRQLDAGIAGQQVSDLIDESYSPDADDALNVITCADVANPTADPQHTSLFFSRRFGGVAKIAAGGAGHDGLAALQVNLWGIADDELAVAGAGEQVADLPQPHLVIHLGVAAAGDVIVEVLRILVDHLDAQRIVFFPQVLQGGEAAQIRAVRFLGGELFARLDGGILDGFADHRLGARLADFTHQNLVDRLDDLRLNLSAGQNAQFVFCTAHRLAPLDLL